MAVLACCPKCRFEGSLPDDDPGGTIACPKCGTEFTPEVALSADAPAVWVGAGAPPTAGVTPPPRKGLNPLPTGADGRPVEITSSNAGKHLDWMKTEVARFDTYVARQMDLLRKRRDELAAAESAAANALVARDLQSTRERATLEADRAALAAERDGLARRAEALDRSERSLQRRLAEVEELEQLLRGELEEREAEVERQRREVTEALAGLRARAPLTPTSTDHILDAGHCG